MADYARTENGRRNLGLTVLALLGAIGGVLALAPIFRAVDSLSGHPLDDRYVQRVEYSVHMKADSDDADENRSFRQEMRDGMKDIQSQLKDIRCGRKVACR